MADRERLVRRTQLQRTPAVIHGQAPPASEDTEPESNEAPEDDGDVPADAATRNQRDKAAAATVVYNESIFDDTDFYHELLRDLSKRWESTSRRGKGMQNGSEDTEMRMRNERADEIRTDEGRRCSLSCCRLAHTQQSAARRTWLRWTLWRWAVTGWRLTSSARRLSARLTRAQARVRYSWQKGRVGKFIFTHCCSSTSVAAWNHPLTLCYLPFVFFAGRKIRYDVHAKLVSFMTPNDTAYGATENAKDALCASLFADVATV